MQDIKKIIIDNTKEIHFVWVKEAKEVYWICDVVGEG